jgi:hypothetical protein
MTARIAQNLDPMASRYHQIVASQGSTVLPGGAIPILSAVVPAGGRLVRFWTMVSVQGVQSSTLGVNTVGPIQWIQAITMDSTTYGVGRFLYHIQEVIPWTSAALYDNQNIPPQRVYTIFHGGGSKALGCNVKCSYGGPGKSALTLKCTTVTTALSGSVNFNLRYDISLYGAYYL